MPWKSSSSGRFSATGGPAAAASAGLAEEMDWPEEEGDRPEDGGAWTKGDLDCPEEELAEEELEVEELEVEESDGSAAKIAAPRNVKDAKAQSKRKPPDINTSCGNAGPERRGQLEIVCFVASGSLDPKAYQKAMTQSSAQFSDANPRCYDGIRKRRCALRAHPTPLLSSSMAEHPAVNRRVVGSSPT